MATELPWYLWRTTPDPGMRPSVELGSGHFGRHHNLVGIDKGLPSVRCPAEQSPPTLDEIEPAGANGNEDLPDSWMLGQPLPHRSTGMTGQIIGDEPEVAVRVGLIDGAQQLQIAS